VILRSGMVFKAPPPTNEDMLRIADLFFYLGGNQREIGEFALKRLCARKIKMNVRMLEKMGWSMDASRCEIASNIIAQNFQSLDDLMNYLEINSCWYVLADDVKIILNKNGLYVNDLNMILPILVFPPEELENMFLDFWEEKRGTFFGCEDVEDYFQKRLGISLDWIIEGGVVAFVNNLGFNIQKITKTMLIPTGKADDLINSRLETDLEDDSLNTEDDDYPDEEDSYYQESSLSESAYDDLSESGMYEQNFDSMCIICFENERKVVIVKCGHLVLCSPCSKLLSECPYCREPFKPNEVIIVYNV